jgi:hypothetical protein
MKQLWQAAEFIRNLRVRLRFGELSRAPLRLLRLEVCSDAATCEWTARPSDPWDAFIPPVVRKDNETFQALRDAVRVRELLFTTLPQIHSAYFRVYRQSGREPPELIITGVSSRGGEPPASLDSLVMRAKLLGFHFSLDDGTLRALQAREGDLELAI